VEPESSMVAVLVPPFKRWVMREVASRLREQLMTVGGVMVLVVVVMAVVVVVVMVVVVVTVVVVVVAFSFL
jgi:hypothetical protein